MFRIDSHSHGAVLRLSGLKIAWITIMPLGPANCYVLYAFHVYALTRGSMQYSIPHDAVFSLADCVTLGNPVYVPIKLVFPLPGCDRIRRCKRFRRWQDCQPACPTQQADVVNCKQGNHLPTSGFSLQQDQTELLLEESEERLESFTIPL